MSHSERMIAIDDMRDMLDRLHAHLGHARVKLRMENEGRTPATGPSHDSIQQALLTWDNMTPTFREALLDLGANDPRPLATESSNGAEVTR